MLSPRAPRLFSQRTADLLKSIPGSGSKSYEKIDLGVIAEFASGLFLQVHADNINDSDGITEGDLRNPAAPNGRPIFGRSFMFSLGYDFGAAR